VGWISRPAYLFFQGPSETGILRRRRVWPRSKVTRHDEAAKSSRGRPRPAPGLVLQLADTTWMIR
jgi:hypothetical protein